MLSSASFAVGQVGQQMALLNSPAYEGAAAPLRGAPPRQYDFSKVVLSDVMRLMAEDAGIGFFGLPNCSQGEDRFVTFTINASPFVALETLAKANGFSLIYESGIWYLRPANDNELIGRIYEINHNAQELVTKNAQSSGTSGGGGYSSSGFGSGGLSLQGAPDFFVTEPSRILDDIQNILDIGAEGGRAQFASTASVDNVAQLSLGASQIAPNIANGGDVPASAEGAGVMQQSKVIWNSDSNTLYVVATRQQHQWIEAYLASADRPQSMIAVEVKFIESSRNPRSDLGIDWDGILGESGLGENLNYATSPTNLDRIGNYSLPTAVLSYSDLNWKLRSIYNDRNTKSVSFPRMVTLDNREVAFRSVINQPVLGSSASASLGADGTETSSIEYIPIGTVINILPKRMKDDKILLNVSVTVSDIVGTEFINGNPFPIATSRVYTAPFTVKSGFTVAISGLDAACTSVNERGLPILGKIPVLRYAFKNRKKDRNRQHLMMLITPIALGNGIEGLARKPVIREPWKQHANSKSTVSDAPPRTNADLYPNGQYPTASGIREVPQFKEEVDPVVKRKASHEFGKKSQLVAAPLEAEKTTRQVGSSAATVAKAAEMAEATLQAAPKGEPQTATQAASQPASTPAPKPNPTVAKADAPKPAPAMSNDKLGEIKSGIAKIEEKLGKVPAGTGKLQADDAQLVVNALESAQELLNDVDEVRGDDGAPLLGELGDVWWQLISLKTKAVRISRRSPESLAINVDGEGKAESDQ